MTFDLLKPAILSNNTAELHRVLDANPGLRNDLSTKSRFLAGESSPLHYAANEDRPDMIRILVEDYSSRLNALEIYDPMYKEEMTALHWAATKGHADAVRMLLKLGGDHQIKGCILDISGTAPQMARKEGQKEVIAVFEEFGANRTTCERMVKCSIL